MVNVLLVIDVSVYFDSAKGILEKSIVMPFAPFEGLGFTLDYQLWWGQVWVESCMWLHAESMVRCDVVIPGMPASMDAASFLEAMKECGWVYVNTSPTAAENPSAKV